jgi:hypothetical protein
LSFSQNFFGARPSFRHISWLFSNGYFSGYINIGRDIFCECFPTLTIAEFWTFRHRNVSAPFIQIHVVVKCHFYGIKHILVQVPNRWGAETLCTPIAYCWQWVHFILFCFIIRPKKNICSFPVTRPTLNISTDPKYIHRL